MAHYLITGGAGFIGSNLVEKLMNDGHDITVIDNLSTGKTENLFDGATFIEADAGDADTYKDLDGSAFDGVVHLAAQSSGAIGQKDPLVDMKSNVASTVNLIHWCKTYNVQRFLYASSMTVYGDGNEAAVDESHPMAPTGYYGVGKMASEHYLQIARTEGLKPTAFRFYSVYGPRQNMDNLKQGILSIYMAYLLKEERLPVTGSLDRYRDLTFVGDVVNALAAALYKEDMPSPVYNIGTGKPTTVKELISTLIDAIGLPKDHPVDELEGDQHDVFGCIANVSRLEKDLGAQSMTPLNDGIAQMLDWLKANYADQYKALS